MANVIEQIVQPKNFGTQTIEMTVRSNERGPQGEKGDTGDAATVNAGDVYTIGYGQTPQVLNRGTSGDAILDFYLPEGKPGAVHYTAGPGISITEDNVIEATGGMAVYWGNIKGTLGNQTDLAGVLNAKQNQLTAGTNITIANNTISAASYTAGSGLNLANGTFSVDTSAIQTKLTAGSNVQINGNAISATDTTYNNFIGADGGSGGSAGLVPAPVASDNVKVLKGDGSWSSVNTDNIANSAVTNAKINAGAVSADKIDFTTMKRWMPNYSAGQSLITGVDNTWTAPGNGFVFVEFTGFSSTGAFATYIRVNGCAVAGEFAEYSNPSGTYVSSLSAFVPVKTGDVITITTGAPNTRNAVAYYTPGIWV